MMTIKHRFCRILPYCLAGVFLLYWCLVFILVFTSGYPRNLVKNRAVRFKALFGIGWQLFTPPNDFNNRLRYIIRDTANDRYAPADTLEVLETIALKKQLAAPFNQKENLVDHMVNNNVSRLLKTVYATGKIPNRDSARDEAYVNQAVAAVAELPNYRIFLQTLKNYGRITLRENHIDPAGKEIQIMITQIMLPTVHRTSSTPILQEITVYKSPYFRF